MCFGVHSVYVRYHLFRLCLKIIGMGGEGMGGEGRRGGGEERGGEEVEGLGKRVSAPPPPPSPLPFPTPLYVLQLRFLCH